MNILINNLNGEGDMAGTSIMTGYIHVHIHTPTQLKKLEILHIHILIQLMQKFFVKMRTNSINTTKINLFAISNLDGSSPSN